MKFSVYQISRQGGRERNEDRMGYAYTREAGLFVLADGMGGHPEGAMAAQLGLQTVSAYFQKAATPTVREVPEFLSSSLMAAHDRRGRRVTNSMWRSRRRSRRRTTSRYSSTSV